MKPEQLSAGLPTFTEKDAAELFKRRHERPGDVFMELLNRDKFVSSASVYDAMGAKIARHVRERRLAAGLPCEYQTVYGSGYAISGMLWGLPDHGFHDLSMMTLVGKYIVTQAHPLPVILDAETGLGDFETLTQTVQAYHDIGVAVAHMEDQMDPRRCGNQGGKECVQPNEMVAKIRSWLEVSAAIDTSMRLIVRTDALTAAGGGIKDAIERAKRYMDVEVRGLRPAMVWADAMMKPEDIDQWTTELHRYNPNMILFLNYSPNKDWTGFYREKLKREPPTYNELYNEGKGFRVFIHTIIQMRADMEATWNTFEDQAENGPKALWRLHERQRGRPYESPHIMTDTHLWQAFEQYIGGQETAERFQKSEGFKGDAINK